MKSQSLRKIGFFLIFSMASVFANADIFIIVHPSNPLDSLTRKEAIFFFTGRYRQFKNGEKAQCIDQPKSSEIRELFYRLLTGKSIAQIDAYWARLLFTGRNEPPVDHFNDSEEIIDAVSSNLGAIAYVWKKDLKKQSVKIVHKITFPEKR